MTVTFRFRLTKHEAAVRTDGRFAAHVAIGVGSRAIPAATEQARRAGTVAGKEQLTVKFRFRLTKHEAVVRTDGRFAAHEAYDVGSWDVPAATEQA